VRHSELGVSTTPTLRHFDEAERFDLAERRRDAVPVNPVLLELIERHD
jgi:hypothetical protein